MEVKLWYLFSGIYPDVPNHPPSGGWLGTSFYLFAFSKANDRYTREQNELDSLRKEVKMLRK
ncbi:MAG: hypothetical protein RLZZ546_1060 [Bacteroidota bacterium]